MLLCATGRKGWEKRDANNQENPQRGGSIPIFITAFATTCSNRGKAQSLWWLLRAGFPEIPTPAPRIRAISKVHSTTCTHSQKPCALSRHSEHICKEPGNLSGLLLLQVQSQKTLANSKADLRRCNYPPRVRSQLCQMQVGTSPALASPPPVPCGHDPRTVVTEILLLGFRSASLKDICWHIHIINHFFCYK